MAWSPDGLPIAGPAALDIAAARAVAVANDAVLTGSGAPVLTADGREHVVAGTTAAPDIGAVARLALRREVRSPATPLYLRKPDAKVQAGYALPRKSP
jgi:tRNA A37 threonylcarbamoyladenosine modification protein TsaB